MTYQSPQHFVTAAPPGARFVYHVGRSLGEGVGGMCPVEQVRDLYNKGMVKLFQRRLSSGQGSQFEYIAVKNRRRQPPAVAYSSDTKEPVHLFRVG